VLPEQRADAGFGIRWRVLLVVALARQVERDRPLSKAGIEAS
jgi:hypothetical protein